MYIKKDFKLDKYVFIIFICQWQKSRPIYNDRLIISILKQREIDKLSRYN